jgi:uncharacterized protein
LKAEKADGGPPQETCLIVLPGDRLTICTIVHTMLMKYEWDPKKATKNFEKHGVRFSDVEPVFEDERALVISENVRGEERSIYLGMDGPARILVVICTVSGDRVRLISARKAVLKEQKFYGAE